MNAINYDFVVCCGISYFVFGKWRFFKCLSICLSFNEKMSN